MKAFVYSENLAPPLDEGIKRTAMDIIQSLSRVATVMAGCRFGGDSQDVSLETIPSNRLLISLRLRNSLRRFNPDVIIYIPRWCGTFTSFIRMKVLKTYNQSSSSVMVNLQPKKLKVFHRKLVRFLKPDVVFSPSPEVLRQMKKLGMRTEFLPLYVNREKFKLLQSEDKKDELRRKYGLSSGKFIILHVGHVNYGRNLEALIPLQRDGNQVVIVSSSSTSEVARKEKFLENTLQKNGIIILDSYLEKIEEIYQLSDVYIFPTLFEGGCIGIPLSVMEARACGLPVITTDFGGLRKVFRQDEKGMIFSSPADFLRNVNRIKERGVYPRRDDGVDQVNELFMATLLKMIHTE